MLKFKDFSNLELHNTQILVPKKKSARNEEHPKEPTKPLASPAPLQNTWTFCNKLKEKDPQKLSMPVKIISPLYIAELETSK